ncbi:MAG: hypothetical protein C0501_25535 [Isosphaera sp.]|nr:hypothetical protein [Isosphaera sp.]
MPVRPYLGYAATLAGAAAVATAPLSFWSDGLVRFESLDRLLRGGTLDGEKYSLYGPVASAPLFFLGEAVGETREVVWVFNRLLILAAAAALVLLFRPALPEAERVRFAALVLCGGMVPWHAMSYFGEVFHTAGVGVGLALVVLRRGWLGRLGWVLAVWGTANVPASAVGMVLAAGVLAWHRRAVRYLLLPAAAAGLILLENWARRGDPLAGGYDGDAGLRTALPYSGRPGFGYPLFFGLLSVLFSFGKGLVFFAPGLFARYPPAAEADRDADVRLVYRVWVAVVVGLVLVYARWWAWYGGAVWGPRFFLFASLPAALVLARRTAHPGRHSAAANLLALAAAGLTCWAGANGLVYGEYDQEEFRANDFALEHLLWYVPECSVLWRPFVFPKPLDAAEVARLAVFAAAFAWLAAPVVRVLGGQFAAGVRGAWRAARSGPGWRF